VADQRGFLAELAPEELDELRAIGTRRHYPAGTTLFTAGEPANMVVVVQRGRIKLSYHTDDGREVVLGVRRDGDVVGELAVLDNAPRSATARALDDVDALTIPAAAFLQLLQERARLPFALLRTLARRLREADLKRIEFGSLDTVGRVASRLVELAQDFGTNVESGVRIDVSLSQQDLAAWTGASREAVSKALQGLRSKGLIETHRRAITVLDPEGLARRAR